MNNSPIWRPGEWQGLEKAQRKYADNFFNAEAVLNLVFYQSQEIAMLAFCCFQTGKQARGRRPIHPNCPEVIIPSIKKRKKIYQKRGGKDIL